MEAKEALITAYSVKPDGKYDKLDWNELDTQPVGDGYVWIHLSRGTETTRKWLFSKSGLDPIVCDALLADETRPRCTPFGKGLIVNLRGVNATPDNDPSDLVSIRLWIEPGRVISTRRLKTSAISEIRDRIEAGQGPRHADDFLVELADRLIQRMETVVTQLDDAVDELEEFVLTRHDRDVRGRIAEVRRQAISLRRYIAPQREAMSGLTSGLADWIDLRHRARLREIADKITRYVEDLDSARERSAIIHEELAVRLSEQMNRTMYTLSIVATIFLPLSLLTGLLGINVGGIPGAETPWAFWAVCGFIVVAAVSEMWVFRRKNLL